MLIRKVRYPELFQGNLDGDNYFEGWYYKQVSRDEKTVISLIPGVSLAGVDKHCFLQYIYVKLEESGGKSIKTGYLKYSLADFSAMDYPFMIRVGDNTFNETSISIKLEDDGFCVVGTLGLGSFRTIRKTLLTPNIMGFFAYFPGMECYHGVISMDHMLHGTLEINGEAIDFNEGKGYIEKDWGTSFPQKYIWIQSNHFKNKGTSFICSVADIPFLNRSFQGFLCNLTMDGKEYRFATYNNSRFTIEKLESGEIALLFENRKAKLKITAKAAHTGDLIAPRHGRMQKTVKEGLSGEVGIVLHDKERDIVHEDVGAMAGIEVMGY